VLSFDEQEQELGPSSADTPWPYPYHVQESILVTPREPTPLDIDLTHSLDDPELAPPRSFKRRLPFPTDPARKKGRARRAAHRTYENTIV